MFTGIVAAVGHVRAAQPIGDGQDMRLEIAVPAAGSGTAGILPRPAAGTIAARRAGGLLLLAAQDPTDPGSTDPSPADPGLSEPAPLPADAASQARACLGRLEAVLASHGLPLAALARCGVFLADPSDAASVLAVLAALADPPACSVSALPGAPSGVRVRLDGIADASAAGQGGPGAGFLVGVALGASICCSGCCLTVVRSGPDWFAVEASAETLSRTTLGGWAVGTPVNLERALRVGDELGGHVVSGHVDGLGRLLSREPENGSLRLRFSLPRALASLVATKGSIAVDGVSLTVNEVRDDTGPDASFGVNVIPHTAGATTLGLRKPGEAVHIEVDGTARALARLHAPGGDEDAWTS